MYGTLIASSTVGSGGTSSIDFTSIPATYTDLFILLSGRTVAQGNVRLNLNASASGFSTRTMYVTGAGSPATFTDTVALGRVTNNSTDTPSTNFGAMGIHLPNYRSSVSKNFSADCYAASYNGGFIMVTAGVWANNAAITSLSLLPPSGSTFIENTSAYLYGVLVGTGGATVSSA
jgi:hypothetical protein